MSEILIPLTSEYGLLIPDDLWALIGWGIGFLGIVFISIWLRDRRFKLDRPALVWSAILSVLILVLTPFIGIVPRTSLALGAGEVPFQHLMFFAAVPWMVAGGVLGVLPATILAGISGFLLAYLDTNSIFTPLILMGAAVFYSWGIRQRYRTKVFQWLRFPVVAAIFSLIVTIPMVFFSLILSATGSIGARVAVAMMRFPMVLFSFGGMVLMGGFVCVIVGAFAQSSWGSKTPLRAAPGEVNIKFSLLAYSVTISMIIMTVVFISSWQVSQNHARKLVVRQMTGTSDLAVKALNTFLETGKQLIGGIATDLRDIAGDSESVNLRLDPGLQPINFFDQISLTDKNGNHLAGFHPDRGLASNLVSDFDGLVGTLIDEGGPLVIIDSVWDDHWPTRVVFVSSVDYFSEGHTRILWAATILEDNLYAQTFLQAVDELGGHWQIIGDSGRVLIEWGRESGSSGVVDNFTFTTPTFFQSKTADGQLLLNYGQPIPGTGWGIAVTLPAVALHDVAWQATFPLLLITAGVLLLFFLLIWFGLSPVIKEMDAMAAAINAVASGKYHLIELQKRARGHRGAFSKAFFSMVTSLHQRMEKQAELFNLSGRIAGQLNVKDALHMILAAALTQGASSARMVFFDPTSAASPDDSDHRLGVGKHAKLLASIDQEIINLSWGKDLIILQGADIIAQLGRKDSILDLDSVIILPLKWKDLRLGVFWVAFTDGLPLEEDRLDYYKELSQMASTLIVNARTYADSQSIRVLMESVLDLVPDAIIVSDHSGRVLYHNQHAHKILGLDRSSMEGKTITSLFKPEDIIDVNWGVGTQAEAKTTYLKDGKALFLITRPVRINQSEVGQAIVFKDLTQQRKEDALKSELVTTVSHELRSPLTLILGYAKILRLTGTLNEQQDVYIGNIIDGVEEMMTLVEKLLDIGRLEWGDALEIRPFSTEAFARRVVKSMEAHAKQKNISIGLDLPDIPLIIEADQTYLTQAIKNLLENAIKFSKIDGEVTMRVSRDEDHIVFSVHDQGIGIAPLDQRKLFKKFGRLSAPNAQEEEGSGLGLAIVKSIAERHGGQVRLESQLGKGSTFYFEIPQNQPD